jgi:peptide/nickel transport system permease protein
MTVPLSVARAAPARSAADGRLRALGRSLAQVPVIPGVVLTIVILTAVFADVLALHSPTATDLEHTFRPPAWVAGGSWSHPLGTDNLGRDIYTRIVHGSRLSLIVGCIVVFIGGSVGTALALIAGYVGKGADALIMRVTDAFFAMPFLVVAIVLAAILGPSLVNLIVVLAAVGWTRYARVIRGEVLRLKEMDFVAAAKLAGTSTPLILWRHIFPNVVNTAARARHPGTRQHGHRRRRPRLSRSRLAPHRSRLGIDACRGAPLHRERMVDRAVSRPRHRRHRAGNESPRRLAALASRPALPPAMNAPAPRSVTVSAEGRTPLLDVRDLRAYFYTRYGVGKAVDGVTFVVHEAETLGIVGESGSGKSVTALSIVRALPRPAGRIVSGKILFEGQDLLAVSEAAMRRVRGSRIGTILQDPMMSLDPVFSIGNQVAEPLRWHLRMSGAALRERVIQLLREVRIAMPGDRISEYPHQMSGGMRQRIVGAMAIACTPKLLIADEPTTALDVTIQAQFLDLLADLKVTHGLAMILITHDLGVVARVCDRVAVMYGGRIVETAPVRELLASPVHPYTQALVGSVPRITRRRDDLDAIEGQPPDVRRLPDGCTFHPRCRYVVDRCRVEYPPETEVSVGHHVKCWLHAGAVS